MLVFNFVQLGTSPHSFSFKLTSDYNPAQDQISGSATNGGDCTDQIQRRCLKRQKENGLEYVDTKKKLAPLSLQL